MTKIIGLLILSFPGILFSQQYNAYFIADSLKKNAGVVERYDERIIEIKSPGKAVQHERHVYTVFNESGNGYGRFVTFYGAFNSIDAVSGTLYDAMGSKIKHMKKSDMEDFSYNDGFSLMGDERYKKYDFYCKTYPYTVDFEEDDDIQGILHFDEWFPASAPGMSVEYSKYIIIAPKDYLVRYKPLNCSVQPVVTEAQGKKTYTWEMKNIPAGVTENMGPSWREIAPRVIMAPSDFEAQGYRGNMNTWENYGKFIYQLTKGRDVLPDDIKRKVHELTDNVKDKRQKVYILYDFLQKNTHYISIQLGIGGWQPFDASYVATKRYGDCKALSNYMVALLKEAGITAKYVEIMAGEDKLPMIEDFPSFQSNHVTCCVPLEKDSIWLECTSQTTSPGYAGTFTGNRKAILIDENGGHVVNTPTYTASDNLELRQVNATIDAEGNLNAEVNTKYTGIRQELPHGIMYGLSKEDQQKYLNKRFNIPTYMIDKSSYAEHREIIPAMDEYLHVISTNYANVSGRRLFITPNIFDKSELKLSHDSIRKYDIINNYAFKDIDSTSLKIPAGFQPEATPHDITIESKFGKYSVVTKVSADKITYYRLYEQYSGRFPAKEYDELVKFYEQVYKADRAKVVMVKTE